MVMKGPEGAEDGLERMMTHGEFALTLISNDPEETLRLGLVIGETLQDGAIVALVGELGAGKTCLTQGIARGLGIGEEHTVTSPTFTLINEYQGRLKLTHLDIYRLSGSADMSDLGYEEYFFGRGVTVIEWAEKIRDILPDGSLFVNMTYLDETRRRIDISGNRAQVTRIEKALMNGGS